MQFTHNASTCPMQGQSYLHWNCSASSRQTNNMVGNGCTGKEATFQPHSEGQDAEFLGSLSTMLDPLALHAGEEPRAAFAGRDLRSYESAPSFYR